MSNLIVWKLFPEQVITNITLKPKITVPCAFSTLISGKSTASSIMNTLAIVSALV